MEKNDVSGNREWKENLGDRIREEIHRSYRKQVDKLEGLEETRLVITLLGGGKKGTVVRELTGISYKELPAEEGFTPKTTVYDVRDNIFFAETPWFGRNIKDPGKYIEEESDLILWFVGDGEQMTEKIKAFFAERAGRGICTLALENPGAEGAAKISFWFEETPGIRSLVVSADDEDTVRDLHEAIIRCLKKRDKEALYLRIARHRETAVTRWVMAAAATAFGIAALPLPGSDNLPLTALQTGLCLRIAYVFESTLSREELATFMTASVTGRAGKKLAALAEEFIQHSGNKLPQSIKNIAIAGTRGLVAAAITYGLGMACYTYYKSGVQGKIQDLTGVFSKFAEDYLADIK